MKTPALNHRHILFGMLLMSLGLSKSWLQTANAEYGHKDLAATAVQGSATVKAAGTTVKPAVQTASLANTSTTTQESTKSTAYKDSRQIHIKGKTEKYDVILTNKERSKTVIKNGHITAEGHEKYIEATITVDGCSSCIEPQEFTGKDDIEALLKELDQKVIAYKTNKDGKDGHLNDEDKEALANCEIDKDGEEYDRFDKRRWKCLAENIETDYPDRKDRREAFQDEIIDELQHALENSTSSEERRKILSIVSSLRKDIGYDSSIKRDLKLLERGSNDYVKIIERTQEVQDKINELNEDSAKNPLNRAMNNLMISDLKARLKVDVDRLAGSYNTSAYPWIARTKSTKDALDDWHSYIGPVAKSAIGSPEEITRRFFADIDDYNRRNGLPGSGVDNGTTPAPGNSTYARSTRQNMPRVIGQEYIPQYLDVNRMSQYAPGNFQNGSGSYFPTSQQPRSTQPYGSGRTPIGQGIQQPSRFPTTQQSGAPQFGPGYTMGGIPQAGRF